VSASLLFVGSAPAAAEVVDPPTGVNWKWKTKSFGIPYSDCTGKLGYDLYQGYLYVKGVIDCDFANPTGYYQLEMHVQRNATEVLAAYPKCVMQGTTCAYGISRAWRVPNPSGSQEWYVTLFASCSPHDKITVPRWNFTA
jgi:hypothetical protein